MNIEKNLKEFVNKIKDNCKKVIDETKKLQEMVIHQNSEITEKEILLAAKSTALTTSKLTDLIEIGVEGVSKCNNENVILQEELLISTSKDVRNNVLKFLKCAKEVFDNPYDYLTSQNLNSALQEVSNSVTNTITTANMLRIIVQKELGDSNNNNKVDVKKEEAKDKIIEAAKEFAGTVRQLVELLKTKISSNQNQPIELMKKLVVNLKLLISVSLKSNFELETNCESLKIATHQLLALSKTYLFEKNSRNTLSLSKIENAAANLASEIRSILMQAQKSSISNPNQLRESPKIDDNTPLVTKLDNYDNERNSISENRSLRESKKEESSTSQESIEDKSSLSPNSTLNKMLRISPQDREKLKKTSQDIINLLTKHIKSLTGEWSNKQEKEKLGIIEEMTNNIEESIRKVHESQARIKSIDLVGRASEQDNVAKQNLNSLFNADSLDDWQEMLTGAKGLLMTGIGGNSTVKISIDNSSGSSSLQDLYNELYNRTLQLIIHANHAVLSEKTTEESVSDKVKQLYETCVKVLSVIGENSNISSNQNVSSLVYNYIECLRSAEIYSPPNEYIVLDAQGQLAQLVYSGLLKQLYTASDSVRVIFLHLLTTLKQMVEDENSPISETSAYQIVASVKTVVEVVGQLLTVVSTARKISYQRANQNEKKVENEEEEQEDVEFWEDYFSKSNDIAPRSEVTQEKSSFPGIKMYVAKQNVKKPLTKKGTLNQLVEAITSVETFDSKYMKTFITTYRSFTSPSKLLEKLIQRYDAPSRVPKEESVNIQLRVGVVIKYWVENQFIDFDDNLVESLTNFIETTLKKSQSDLSELLYKQVVKLDEARKNKITIFQKPPTNLTTPPGQYNPSELFFQMSTDEIARQITIIDWSIFSAIEPSELLNQSWNKISLQHRAQNVFALVSRLNKVSYWIPAMILWQQTYEQSCSMITKFMEIGIYLYKLNNYNGLMGVIAGLNMSSVSRLKRAWGTITEQNNSPNSILSQYRKLETLMSPTGSWKNYRSSLSTAKLPAIPYLGTYLGDLTFIDEGNPNYINKQINFEKRELIYNIIYDVKRFQAQSFKFPIVEPIHTLLAELPSFSDKDMYGVSLFREPRENKSVLSSSGSNSNLNKK